MSEATDRLEKLAGESSHAARSGVFLTPVWRDSEGDGTLARIDLSMVCEEMTPGELYRTEVSFPGESNGAEYSEILATREGTTGVVYDLPVDFTEGYRLADIWEDDLEEAGDASWETLAGPREVIDFLADRMAARFRDDTV